MKNLTLLLIVCGLIFAAGPIAFNLESNTAYASIDWRKYLPKPIIIPPTDTLITPTLPEKLESLKEPAAPKNIAYIDMRRFLPKPIIIPLPEPDSASANMNLASI